MKENLEIEKLQHEILMLKEQITSEKHNRFSNVIKGIVLGVGSAILFWVITMPESIISRKVSEEALERERAKLLIDCLKEKDPIVRAQSIKILQSVSAYPKIDSIIRIENTVINQDIETIKNKLIGLEQKFKFSQNPNQKEDIEIAIKILKAQLKEIQ